MNRRVFLLPLIPAPPPPVSMQASPLSCRLSFFVRLPLITPKHSVRFPPQVPHAPFVMLTFGPRHQTSMKMSIFVPYPALSCWAKILISSDIILNVAFFLHIAPAASGATTSLGQLSFFLLPLPSDGIFFCRNKLPPLVPPVYFRKGLAPLPFQKNPPRKGWSAFNVSLTPLPVQSPPPPHPHTKNTPQPPPHMRSQFLCCLP